MIGVYIVRGHLGEVLYVGSSNDIETRLISHRSKAQWWPLMASVERIPTANKTIAGHKERELIKSLEPIWNRKSRGGAKRVDRQQGPVIRPKPEAFASLIEAYGSVPALARDIGSNPQTLSDVWRGVHYASSQVVARLIVVTGIPFDELFYIDPGDLPVEQWLNRRERKEAA